MTTLNSMLFAMVAAVPVLAAQAEVAPTPVNLQVGQKTSLVLDGNPTTGYIWQTSPALPADSPVEVQLSYLSKADADMCCGFPTPTTVTITALKPGTQVVRLVYARPWEKKKAPAKTESFKVIVSPAQK
jgi:predicted secreted protein